MRLYWPVELRPAFDALFDIDETMGDVVSRSSEPTLAAIKLAWWRERLVELDQGKVPAEPRLQAAAAEILPRGIRGAELAGLEADWAVLLQEYPHSEATFSRGRTLFALASRMLGADPPGFLELAGQLYAAGNLFRRGLAPEGLFVITEIPRVPKPFRPLTGLAALALRDLRRREPEGIPARAWALLRHRMSGYIR